MLKRFDFECLECHHTFDDLVEGVGGKPEECPQCGQSFSFQKLPSAMNIASTIVPSYPGSKRVKAGYQHTHNRPAEKKGTQVSMHGTQRD